MRQNKNQAQAKERIRNADWETQKKIAATGNTNRDEEENGVRATSNFARSGDSMKDTRNSVPGDRDAQEGGEGAEMPETQILLETISKRSKSIT